MFGRVGFSKDLSWCLSKLGYLRLKGQPLHWVIQRGWVCLALISDWVKHIVIVDRALLIPKNQVDPLMQILGYVV